MVQAQAVRQLSYVQAVNEALRQEMQRDPTVFIMGEDIAGGAGRADDGKEDAWGGVFRLTKGLIGEFGAELAVIAGHRRVVVEEHVSCLLALLFQPSVEAQNFRGRTKRCSFVVGVLTFVMIADRQDGGKDRRNARCLGQGRDHRQVVFDGVGGDTAGKIVCSRQDDHEGPAGPSSLLDCA